MQFIKTWIKQWLTGYNTIFHREFKWSLIILMNVISSRLKPVSKQDHPLEPIKPFVSPHSSGLHLGPVRANCDRPIRPEYGPCRLGRRSPGSFQSVFRARHSMEVRQWQKPVLVIVTNWWVKTFYDDWHKERLFKVTADSLSKDTYRQ